MVMNYGKKKYDKKWEIVFSGRDESKANKIIQTSCCFEDKFFCCDRIDDKLNKHGGERNDRRLLLMKRIEMGEKLKHLGWEMGVKRYLMNQVFECRLNF